MLENGGFIGLIVGVVVCGIIAAICFKVAKKSAGELKTLLESMTDEEKNLVKNQTFAKSTAKDMFTSNVFIAAVNEEKDKLIATILYFDANRGEFFYKDIKAKKKDAVAPNLVRGNFVPAMLKYDKDMCYYDFKKFI